MKVSVGVVCSVLGATIAFYLAILSLVILPDDGTALKPERTRSLTYPGVVDALPIGSEAGL